MDLTANCGLIRRYDFGGDWEAYSRTHADELDPETLEALRKLREEYKKKKDDYEKNPDAAHRDALYKAGYELCRRKNALKRVEAP